MWCLVSLPNGTTTLACQCDAKADGPSIGQQCLEQVCKNLEIKCETEYFGLVEQKHLQKPKKSTNYEWINLRNPLHHQTNGQQYLELRIKFWVPAHAILQESVRNIFYMQARLDLLEGRLNAVNWDDAAKLGALLAQADEIKYDLDLSQSISSTIINSSVVTTDAASSVASTIPANGNEAASGGAATGVKCMKRKLSTKQKSFDEAAAATVALTFSKSIYDEYIVRPSEEFELENPMPADFLARIAAEHSKLASLNMSGKSAKYWLLETISKLPNFGEETFTGCTLSEPLSKCDVSVGPHGIVVYKADEQIRIPFSAASTATPFKNTFRLQYVTETGTIEDLEIKLPRNRAAQNLYRAITEKHAFYSCETVCSDVTKQFIRDLKGTIASMFNVDTKRGKLYMFDIQRTSREVHDYARRVLHSRGIEIAAQQTEMPELDADFETYVKQKRDKRAQIEFEINGRIAEAVTCRICMDNLMEISFAPCGHIVCCRICAEKCDRCPLCRAEIFAVNRVYLPTELTASTSSNHQSMIC